MARSRFFLKNHLTTRDHRSSEDMESKTPENRAEEIDRGFTHASFNESADNPEPGNPHLHSKSSL